MLHPGHSLLLPHMSLGVTGENGDDDPNDNCNDDDNENAISLLFEVLCCSNSRYQVFVLWTHFWKEIQNLVEFCLAAKQATDLRI